MSAGFRIDYPRRADVEAYREEHNVSLHEARRIMDRVALEHAARSVQDERDIREVLAALIRRVL